MNGLGYRIVIDGSNLSQINSLISFIQLASKRALQIGANDFCVSKNGRVTGFCVKGNNHLKSQKHVFLMLFLTSTKHKSIQNNFPLQNKNISNFTIVYWVFANLFFTVNYQFYKHINF